ncbi:MAG: sigma-70 family RNA polymerase sigma factor [Candidatus Acidiferrales bacterium]
MELIPEKSSSFENNVGVRICARTTNSSATVSPNPVIQDRMSGVWHIGKAMDAFAASRAEPVTEDVSLEREFHERLAECATLAFRVALGVLRDRAEAEDVAQESLLRAYRNFHRLRNRATFRSWLVRIAWRMAIDHRRARKRRERHEEDAAQNSARETGRALQNAEEVAASREFERRLHEELDALPEKLRIVMVMAAVEGYDTREVAQLLQLPEGTVKSRLRLARKRLAEKLH